jgi:WD40 repeat protein
MGLYIFLLFSILIIINIDLLSNSKIIYPTSNDTLIVGNNYKIQWLADDNAPTDLYYSTDNGISWLLLSQKNTQKYYDWIVPPLDSLRLQFRLESKLFIPPFLIWELNNVHNGEVRSAFLSKDDKYIISSGIDYKAKLIEVSTKNFIDSVYFLDKRPIYYANFFKSIDSIFLSVDNTLYLWDRITDNLNPYPNITFGKVVRSCDVLPDDGVIAAGSYDGSCKIFSGADGSILNEIKDTINSEIYSVRFSHDGLKIALATYSGELFLFDWKSGSLINVFGKHGSQGMNTPIWSVDFSPDDSLLISGGVDLSVRIWDIKNKKIIDTLLGHEGHIRAVGFHPNNRLILSASLDNSIRQWNSIDGSEITEARIDYGAQVITAGYSTTGDTIISAGRDGAIRLWRNFQYFEYFDTVKCILNYPILVSIPNITASIGDYIKIPVNTSKGLETDYIKSLKYDISMKVEIPKRILEVLDKLDITNSRTRKDTIAFRFSNVSLKDVLTNISALVLFGDVYFEEIRLTEFHLLPDSIYQVSTNDGSIKIELNCEGESLRKIDFSDTPMMANISPIPAKDFIYINLILIEDGFYYVEMYNSFGKSLGTILEKKLNSGSYKFSYSINDYKPGVYFIRLSSPSGRNFSKSFVIVK